MVDDPNQTVTLSLTVTQNSRLKALQAVTGRSEQAVLAAAMDEAVSFWIETEQYRRLDETEFEHLQRLINQEWSFNSDWFSATTANKRTVNGV